MKRGGQAGGGSTTSYLKPTAPHRGPGRTLASVPAPGGRAEQDAQQGGRRYRAGKRQGGGEMGPVRGLVQEIVPLYMSPAGPRSCQT